MNTTKTITLTSWDEKLHHADQVWYLLSQAYKNVKGGLHFSSISNLIESTSQWKVIIKNNKVIAVTIYKAKQGLKIVAFAACKIFRDISIPALIKLLKKELKTCWIEVSEKAEEFILKYCNGYKYIMSNNIANIILNKAVQVCDDGIHYIRTIQGINKEKLLLGTIQLESRI